MSMELQHDRIESPIGTLHLVTDSTRLCALGFQDCDPGMLRRLTDRYGRARLVEKRDPQGFSERLRSYFEGELDALDEISVVTNGTAFQEEVWTALRQIPPGATTNYGVLAARLGRPNASRAVGLANSRNPVAIVVPCHRVIGADGSLTGYAGGLERKRWLIAHEAAYGFTLK